jgi:multiple sugar transport system permease protein
MVVLKILLSLLVLLVTLFPLAYMTTAGFKSEMEILSKDFHLLPQVWEMENYRTLLEDALFVRSIWLTFVGAVIFALVGSMISAMAAYVFARLEFPLKKVLWPTVLLTMFIPWMSIFVTSFITVTKLGMLDSLWVLIVPGLASAANVFFFRQFYLFFPPALEEAAVIDGCSRFGIFWRIFIPNSLSIFVIISIMRFMQYWNSYIWAVMTISSDSLYTMMQRLSYFRTDYGNNWGVIMAGSSIAAVPPLILLAIFQKYIIKGVKIAGIK